MVSIRGRRLHSHIRRSTAQQLSPRALDLAFERADTPEADANRLIETLRVRAYPEARRRQRLARSSEAASHWSRVANLIARRTGDPLVDESPMPSEGEPNLARDGEERRTSAPVRCFEVDPVDELERVLAVKPQRFRLQFFGVACDLGPAILAESEIESADASGAIRQAVEANWPARAVGLRLLDFEGREIFARLKADLR
jgi:hypothetical protein